ncbi:hypothetical protein A2U01_0062577, partial [Trifolium medium]|nr:hypothetical protein [Trifolium medium]
SVAEEIVDITIPSFAAVNDQIDVSEKVSTRPVNNSVKENSTTPNVEPDVEASSAQHNPKAATVTDSFSSESDDATEPEIEQEDMEKEKSVDVEDSRSEESAEKTVSLGEEDTESEKT